MKKVLFAISTFALLMGAASCQDELSLEKVDNTTIGSSVANPLNTITVKMGDATRLGLDGKTPVFEAGDEVFGWDADGNYTYQCTSVSGTEATFTRTSEYAPSADEGTKVNLVFANGYSASDIVSGELSLDISKQDINSFEALPVVMTASGSVDAEGKCAMTFVNETSVIKIDNCDSPSAQNMISVEGRNLYPTMSITIDADGNFVKTPGAAATISNISTATFKPGSKVDDNYPFSFWLATFPTPESAAEADVKFLIESSTSYTYMYDAGNRTINANKLISLSGKHFSNVYAELVETGEIYSNVASAITAANAYSGPCTLKILTKFTNSTAKSITNTAGVTLDLNGRTITFNGKSSRLNVTSGGKLIIDGDGTITISTATNTFAVADANSTLVLNSGTLTNGGDVAVVYVSAGNFEMNGGSITGSKGCGAMSFESAGKLTLNGGTIIGTNATYGAVNISNADAEVVIDGAVIKSADNVESGSAHPAMRLSSGKLTLKSGTIGSSKDSRGIQVNTGTFTMQGGAIIAKYYPFYCNGVSTINISGGTIVEVNNGWKVFYATNSSAGTSIGITGGYIFAPHSTSYSGFYTFGGTTAGLAGLTINVSGGYFTEDLSNTSAGYHDKLTLNGTLSSCTGVTDTFGNSYTYQVIAN